MMVLIGHRGCHGPDGAFENTLPAFEAAVRCGADLVELDVWCTRDGALVVHHDERLPGAARPISQQTAAEVRTARLRGDEPVPTLPEVLELLRGRVAVNVELKHGAALARAVDQIRRLRMVDQIILSSFDLPTMNEAADVAPDIERAVIMGTSTLNPGVRLRETFPFWAIRRAKARFWHPDWRLVGPAVVEALHRIDVRVNAWTVNEPRLAGVLDRMGVDGIFTDEPAAMRLALTG